MNRLTRSEQKEVYGKLLQGAVYRSSLVSLFFAVSFVVYGLTSLSTFQKFDPSITLWANVWPRFVLNGLPFLLCFGFFQRYKQHTHIKIWLWTIVFPLIMLSACTIHAWPLILGGHHELYLYVHAANALVLVMAMIMVGPPPKFLALGVTANLLFFVLPLSAIFIHLEQFFILKFFITDIVFAFLLGGLGSHMNYTLRRKLATEDVVHKRKVEKFLGSMVSESIFENDETLVRSRRKKAFLISIDVRGFTQFSKTAVDSHTSVFKERYHSIVSKIVGELGGFIHKTHGDGHLISVGLMTPEADLSDMPELKQDLEVAEKLRLQQQLAHAVYFFEKLVAHFEELKKELLVEQDICVCGAIDYGEIGLKMLGDPSVRLEFDIEGLVVIRCTRLEAYTKTLREIFGSANSFLVVSADATVHLSQEFRFQTFFTKQQPIKDFPDQSYVSYKEYAVLNWSHKGAA